MHETILNKRCFLFALNIIIFVCLSLSLSCAWVDHTTSLVLGAVISGQFSAVFWHFPACQFYANWSNSTIALYTASVALCVVCADFILHTRLVGSPFPRSAECSPVGDDVDDRACRDGGWHTLKGHNKRNESWWAQYIQLLHTFVPPYIYTHTHRLETETG